MVELRHDDDVQGPVVTGFTPVGFKIGTKRYDDGLLLSPQEVLDWKPSAYSDLELSDIMSGIDLHPKPEFLLIGSGPNMLQPTPAFRCEADDAGIGLEVMDSRSAARTWGILRAEERWIIAALMPLS